MDHRQMCVSNVKYKKPSQNESRRNKNLLKYLTYRDSRDDYVPQVSGKDRWIDHGMGSSVAQIADRCEAYHSEHVLVFTLVINPNPALIEMVPHRDRERFLHELTENTVENFFVERGIDTGVEYSWVMHHRQTDDMNAPGRHNPHAHIILPGTYYDADEGQRVPLYFSRNRSVNHIEMLHDITEQNMEVLMERYVGLDWERQYDAQHLEVKEQQVVETTSRPEPEAPWASSFDISF